MTGKLQATRLLTAVAATLVALAAVWSAPADAQAYPTRPITVIVPVQPGATHDAFMRLIQPRLSAALGQPIVVENRNGAGQSIGTLTASRAKPDGHTLLLASNAPFTINPVVSKVGYNPVTDFEPIINIGSNSLVLVTNPNLPAKTLPALIALAKSKKGELLAASSGNGSTAHLALSQFNTLAGVDITHVPYKGGPAALNDVVSGQVSMAFAGPTAAMPLVKQGRLQMLAYAGSKRSVFLPDLPTVAEQGVTGFSVDVWFGLFVPKGTPRHIVQRLNTEIATLIRDPDIARQMQVIGIESGISTPEELGAQIRREIPVWRQIVTKAGVIAD
ncbi:MAG: tripartite tricarboxylate transporter substrate binding protein [Pseudomonadota bacterium]